MATETDAASAAGMPQLEFSTFPNQIFWLVITLLAIYYIVTRMAMPRISETLGDRQEAIAGDLEQAAALKLKAQEAEAAYTAALAAARAKAQEIATEARAEIQKDVDAATAKANAEIAAKAAESEARIAEIRDSAMTNVEAVAKDTAVAIVDALLPGSGSADAVEAAVQTVLKG